MRRVQGNLFQTLVEPGGKTENTCPTRGIRLRAIIWAGVSWAPHEVTQTPTGNRVPPTEEPMETNADAKPLLVLNQCPITAETGEKRIPALI